MKTYTQEELKSILDLHAKWLRGESGGIRADLSHANLRNAYLRYSDLLYANLSHANLSDSDLSYSNLSHANLRYSDLLYANLSHANLLYSDLRCAKYGNCEVLRAPICVHGARNVVEEYWSGIRIGCENNVTSYNLAQLFEKYETPESMRPLYIAAVKIIEDYAKAWPLLSAKKEDQ